MKVEELIKLNRIIVDKEIKLPKHIVEDEDVVNLQIPLTGGEHTNVPITAEQLELLRENFYIKEIPKLIKDFQQYGFLKYYNNREKVFYCLTDLPKSKIYSLPRDIFYYVLMQACKGNLTKRKKG